MAKPTLLASSDLLALAAPRCLRDDDYCRGDDHLPRGSVSALSWAFRADSLALCALGRRSALDGLCRAPGVACAPLFLPHPAMCAADLNLPPPQRRCALCPAH